MSQKLRALIRAVRACKTAAEERAVIAQECALIRTSFRDNDEKMRARNLAKLLYIHMLGYPSHFGQMECIKLMASPAFADKRVGYLGLTLMLQERDEVLMLATNSLKVDLNSTNPFIVGLALAAVGNLSTPDMARDLANEVDKHLKETNQPYLRKKAALCTVRVLTKCPELIEDFVDRAVSLLKDRSHGVLLGTLSLLATIVKLDAAQAPALARLVPTLVRMLRGFLTAGFTAEHDVSGVTDPFLQVSLLRLMCLLAEYEEASGELLNDILAQVATTTETAKNAGNSILYECVHTIMRIDSEQGLRLLAVNILGRFLLNRDNNMRYVALNTLSRVVAHDPASVQRHRATIVDCLKDPDISIRQRALELIFQLVNESTVEVLTTELLNYLVVAPSEHRRDLCSKVLLMVEAHAPSPRWRTDTLITTLSIAGQHCDDSVPAATMVYISQSSELHAYATHKVYRLLCADLSQPALTLVGVWCIGEYSDGLQRPCTAPAGSGAGGAAAAAAAAPFSADGSGANGSVGMGSAAAAAAAVRADCGYAAVALGDIVDLLERIMRNHFSTPVTHRYILTALTKMMGRLPPNDASGAGPREAERAEGLLSVYKGSMQLELQARSCEYLQLLRPEFAPLRLQLLDRMPVLDESAMRERRARFAGEWDDDEDASSADGGENGNGTVRKRSSPPRPSNGRGAADGGGAAAAAAPTAAGSAAAAAAAAAAPSLLDLDDVFGGGGGNSAAAGSAAAGAAAAQGGAPPGTGDLLSSIFAGPAAGAATSNSPPSFMDGGASVGSGGSASPPGASSSSLWGAAGVAFPVAPPAAAAAGAAGTAAAAAAVAVIEMPVMEKGGVVLTLLVSKPEPGAPEKSEVLARFANRNDSEVTDLHFQVAVPKYLRLEMLPASGTRMPPASEAAAAGAAAAVEQRVRLTNTLQGQKPIMLKIKVEWRCGGQAVTELLQVSSFPAGY